MTLSVGPRPSTPRCPFGTMPARARPWRLLAAAAVALSLAAPAGAADTWPAHPIRIVVGVPAGSPADLSARLVADGMERELGVRLFVDNRPGADGIVAVGQVTPAPADGHTLLFGLSSQLAINPATYATLPYDPQRNLAPISMVARQPFVVAVHPSLPVATLKELVDYTRARPGTVNYSAGTSTFMLATEALKRRSGADMQHIPFNGAGPAVTALVAGTVQVSLVPANGALGSLQAGKMRAIAVSGMHRLAQLPDVPTLAEQGLPDDVEAWSALLAPAGTPRAILDRLHGALVRTLASPPIRAKFLANAEIPAAGTPEELAATIARDGARMEALVRQIGLAPR